MPQGITTTIIYPTKREPAQRVVASCFAGQVTLAYADDCDKEANHRAAVQELLQQLGWSGLWVGGSIRGKVGQSKVAFCLASSAGEARVSFERGFAESVDIFS